MAIAGGQKAGRRRDKGQHVPSTPADVGATLRDAREADGVTMADVHDRTGISWKHIEALESGDLAQFSDRRTALTYLGRYPDLFGLDTSTLAPAVEEHWPEEVVAGAWVAPADTGSQPASRGTGSNGHLSRFPGDRSHLLSFTQTAQVPGVRSATPANVNNYNDAGALLAGREFTYYPPTRPVPWALRAAVWLTAMLVVVGVLGLAVHRYDPQLLVSMHLVKSAQGSAPAPPPQTQPTTAATSPPVTLATATETSTTPNSAAVQVNATQYSVVVSPSAPVWTRVDVAGATVPVFEGTLQAGETKTFSGASGPLSVNLGAAKVTLQVLVSGSTLSAWSLTPPAAPYTVTFTPATS